MEARDLSGPPFLLLTKNRLQLCVQVEEEVLECHECLSRRPLVVRDSGICIRVTWGQAAIEISPNRRLMLR